MSLITVFYFLLHFPSMNGEDRHEFHISVCDIKYVASSESLQISHRIFLDGLEKALILFGNDPSIDVTHPKDPKKLDSLVILFVKNHVEIAVNQKLVTPQYIGSEIKDDVMVVYAEIHAIDKLKIIKITNDILVDLYSDQMNIVHVQYQDKTKSMRLSKSKATDAILFD